MSIFKAIGKWLRGCRLDKIFSSVKGTDISIQDAAQKASDFLVNVQGFIISPEAEILEVILGDTWKDIVNKASEILPEVIADLEQVKVIPDVAVKLQDYKFFEDEEKDKLYHDIVTCAALIFSDGKLSISDAAIALQLLASFKK